MSSPTRISPNPIVDNPLLATGSRDDASHGVDLPLVDLVAQAPPEAPPQFRNWPGPVARWQWAIEVGIAQNLSALQMATLQHVCMRAGQRNDGKAPGCYQSAENIGTETRHNRKHVGLALAALVKKGLLERISRFHNTNIYRPTFRKVNESQRHIDMSHSLPLTRNKPEGVVLRGTKSLKVLSKEEQLAIVDNADSCGFTGCPPVGQLCPMCGRQGTAAMAKG